MKLRNFSWALEQLNDRLPQALISRLRSFFTQLEVESKGQERLPATIRRLHEGRGLLGIFVFASITREKEAKGRKKGARRGGRKTTTKTTTKTMVIQAGEEAMERWSRRSRVSGGLRLRLLSLHFSRVRVCSTGGNGAAQSPRPAAALGFPPAVCRSEQASDRSIDRQRHRDGDGDEDEDEDEEEEEEEEEARELVLFSGDGADLKGRP
jgi:hypothetical protein